jgi:hypothetical protein
VTGAITSTGNISTSGSGATIVASNTAASGAAACILQDDGVHGSGLINYSTSHASLANQTWIKNYRDGGSLYLAPDGGNTATAVVSSTGLSVNGNISVPSGYGIDFSATSNATGHSSSLLDDYEEGTWTPTVSDGARTTYQSQRYTKIGRQVTVNCYVYQITSNSDDVFTLGGLPFPLAGADSIVAIESVWLGTSAPIADIVSLGARAWATNGSVITVNVLTSGGTGHELTYAELGSSAHVKFTLTYFTA